MTLTRTESIYVSMDNIIEGVKEYYQSFHVDFEDFDPDDLIKCILEDAINDELKDDSCIDDDEDDWFDVMSKEEKLEVINLAVPILIKLTNEEVINNVNNGVILWKRGL